VVAIVYAVNIELRPFLALRRDILTASKLRANPQLIQCDRIFVFELRIIKVFDIPLQIGRIDVLDRIGPNVLCYDRLRILAPLAPNLPYALEAHLPVCLPSQNLIVVNQKV
jgi:hypothetical protein